MGAWGAGVFDDDMALDFLADLEEDPELLRRYLVDSATTSGYLDAGDGPAYLAAAAVVAQRFDHSIEIPYPHAEVTRSVSVSPDLIPLALKAIERVTGDQSELAELWAENPEYDNEWKNICKRLSDILMKAMV